MEVLSEVSEQLHTSGKQVLLNVDTCPGLGRDEAALDFLLKIGLTGVMSTRVPVLQKARSLGLFTTQVVFLTDRTSVERNLSSVRSTSPNLVQLMPFPAIYHLTEQELNQLPAFTASGFVRTAAQIDGLAERGCAAAATTEQALWLHPRQA